MNKTAIAFVSGFMAFSCMAQETGAKPADGKVPHEERWLIHEAGMVETRQEGAALCIIDYRDVDNDLSGISEKIERFTRLIVKRERRKAEAGVVTAGDLLALLGKERGAIVAIVDDGASPSLTVLPEDGVVSINARHLKDGLPEKDAERVFGERLDREIWRAVAFALGGYETEYKCVLKNIRSPQELDALPRNTCPPVSERVEEGAAKLGLARMVRVTYASALLDGVAPPPKTEAQRKLADYYRERGLLPAATNAPAVTPPAK